MFRDRSNWPGLSGPSLSFRLFFGFVFVMILVGWAAMAFVGVKSYQANGFSGLQYGFNGITESRCINGYAYTIGPDGRPVQTLDEFGKGVKCQKATPR